MIELAIGNVIRRVLYIIREEYLNALKVGDGLQDQLHPSPAKTAVVNKSFQQQARSLGTILNPGTDTDLSMPIADLKLVRLYSSNYDFVSEQLLYEVYHGRDRRTD
jgi:translation initiation factor eIF-2B subunit beta